MLSGIYLNENYGCQFEVQWEKTYECFADFSDLFEPIKDIPAYPLNNLYLKRGTIANLYFPNLLRKFRFDASFKGKKIADLDFCKLTNGKKNIYITSYNRFCPHEIKESVSRYFIPIPELQKKISQITDTYQGNVIGVHIRRTDNVKAIRNNPLEQFFSSMDREIEKNSQVRFYLATDSDDVKTRAKERYKDRIITLELSLSRENKTGMQDAVVDLYCLAATSKIIGCTHSTYSLMASWIHNAQLQLHNS